MTATPAAIAIDEPKRSPAVVAASAADAIMEWYAYCPLAPRLNANTAPAGSAGAPPPRPGAAVIGPAPPRPRPPASALPTSSQSPDAAIALPNCTADGAGGAAAAAGATPAGGAAGAGAGGAGGIGTTVASTVDAYVQ